MVVLSVLEIEKENLLLILDANNHMNIPIIRQAKLSSVIYILIILASGIFLGCKATSIAQSDSIPVKFENETDSPLAITEAQIVAGEPREMTLEGTTFDGKKVRLIHSGEKGRRIRFTVKLFNRSDRDIWQFIVRIQNPPYLSEESILTTASLHLPASFRNLPNLRQAAGSPGEVSEIKPQETYTFTTTIPFNERKNNVELMNHLSDFQVKIVEAGWGIGQENEWILGGKLYKIFGSVYDHVWAYDCEAKTRFEIVKKDPAKLPDMPASGRQGVQMISFVNRAPSCPPQGIDRNGLIQADPTTGRPVVLQAIPSSGRSILQPTILYKEQPDYTPEARANKIQGAVILNVLFTAEGQITIIRVVSGLPFGLTEKAIEAVRKTRFQPPLDDNGVPVSVSRNIEFTFELDK
jgi:TonB family protein